MIGQTKRDYYFIYMLAWEPSATQVTYNYSCRLPALRLLNLESQNQAKNIPVALPRSPTKVWGKSVNGFLSYDRINKQTNRDYNFIYIDKGYTIIQFITPLEWYNEKILLSHCSSQILKWKILRHFWKKN